MISPSKRSSRGSLFLAAVGLFGLLALTAVIFVPVLIRPKPSGHLTACKSNLKNFGTALEMYSTDYGRYPSTAAQLTPNYLKTLPQCPTAMRDTYSQSYVRRSVAQEPSAHCRTHGSEGPCANYGRRLLDEASRFRDREQRWPNSVAEMNLDPKLTRCPYSKVELVYYVTLESYLVSCSGLNHKAYGIPADRPAYDGIQGLIER